LYSTEEENDAFHEDWIRLGAGKDVDFSSYACVDSKLAMCIVSSFNELSIDHKGGGQ
jgi:hypothetical protein